jgi:hypothetical protein
LTLHASFAARIRLFFECGSSKVRLPSFQITAWLFDWPTTRPDPMMSGGDEQFAANEETLRAPAIGLDWHGIRSIAERGYQVTGKLVRPVDRQVAVVDRPVDILADLLGE